MDVGQSKLPSAARRHSFCPMAAPAHLLRVKAKRDMLILLEVLGTTIPDQSKGFS